VHGKEVTQSLPNCISMPIRVRKRSHEKRGNVTSKTLLTDLTTKIISIVIGTVISYLLTEFSLTLIPELDPRVTLMCDNLSVNSRNVVTLNSPQSLTDESKVTSERDRSYFLPRQRYPVIVRFGRSLTVANDGSGNEQGLADSCLSFALRSEHEEVKLSSGETGSSGELCDCSSVTGFHVHSSSRGSSGVGSAANCELCCVALRCVAMHGEGAKCVGIDPGVIALSEVGAAEYGAAFGMTV